MDIFSDWLLKLDKQPLDMGIIRSEKAYYKKALVKHCRLKNL